jgi:pimeloyl-ACP methyl ester carboxylesterase
MEKIKTPSFELAIYKKGDKNAEKLILCLPGRLDTKDYAHMRSHVDFFASKGYLAISFDPPGTWESSDDISLYTTQNYLKAVDELIELYGNRPTITLGHSRGGTMAMMAGINNKYVTHFVAVMSHYGPSEKPKELGDVRVSYRDLPPGTEETLERKSFNLPMGYFDDPTPYTGLELCAKPKLFFLGKHDDLVLPEEVRETYGLAAEPKQLHELDSNHDYRYHSEIIKEVEKAIEGFLI